MVDKALAQVAPCCAFYKGNVLLPKRLIQPESGAGTTTLTITGTFVIAANSLIYIQNATDANANGWWFTAAGGTNTMTVITSNTVTAGAQYNAALDKMAHRKRAVEFGETPPDDELAF